LHSGLRPLLNVERTVGQWLSLIWIPVAAYLLVGVIWAVTHTERFARLTGLDVVVSFLGSIAQWPVLVFTLLCR
jgi:hypothetical protein